MIKRLAAALNALIGKSQCVELPAVRLLEIDPEDKLIVECEQLLKSEQREYLIACMSKWLEGDDMKVLVMDGGLRIVAVRNKR